MSTSAQTTIDSIPTLTSHTFEGNVLLAAGPVAVEFMSHSCARCRELEPVLLRATSLLSSRLGLYRVNVATERTLADAYAIEETPTFVKFLGGREIGRFLGSFSEVESLVANLTRGFDA